MLARFRETLEKMAAERPVMLAFLVFTFTTLVVVPASLPFYLNDTRSFLENIMAEAHGMIFDLLVIGWFIMWLDKRAERRLLLRGYQEEIDNFLRWESPEAMHRITGNIRRLNREGVTKINLEHAFLRGAYLVGIDLAGARLRYAILSGARLEKANLEMADLVSAVCELSNLTEANLQGASLINANLQGAYLERANLQGAYLKCANLQGTYLVEADLSGTHLAGANFQGAYLVGTDLRGTFLEETNLGAAKTLYGARLDPEVEAELRAQHPALFEDAGLVLGAPGNGRART